MKHFLFSPGKNNKARTGRAYVGLNEEARRLFIQNDKDLAEIERRNAETRQLMTETPWLMTETKWHPLMVGAGIFAAAMALTKLFL